MDIPQIKQQLNIQTVLAHYQLTPDKNKMLHCPFHPDKTPSMQVYPDTGTVYCFSSNCKLQGKAIDGIDFIMYKEGCNKHEAIEKAKSLLGSPTTKPDTSKELEVPPKNLNEIFRQLKTNFGKSKGAQTYAKKRHLNTKALEAGYNPKSSKSPGSYPHLKGCLIFPLKNPAGQIVSLYGRSSTEEKDRKHYYLKDRQGLYPTYPKASTKKLILSESIIDAATLLQQESISKEYEILALYGTNGLTAEHKTVIKELEELTEIILFFDGDSPGETAAAQHSKTLHQLKPGTTISQVATPQGEDINSLLQGHEPEILEHLLEERSPLFLSNENKSSSTLNTTNPEHITYSPAGTQKPRLQYSLLGGINHTQLDRLRVTLKLRPENSHNPQHNIRHHLDLYNDDQVERFIHKASEKLEISSPLISRGIAGLTEAIEQYRLAQLQAKKEVKPKKHALSPEGRKAAITYLKAPDLLLRTNRDIGRSGITGEENNRLLMYLIFTSRLREEPLHIISLGPSGTGKTWLQEKVSQLIPEQDKLEITILSDNALYYFKQTELKNKLILIEDMDGAENVLYPLRELMSKKRISKTIPIKDSKGNLKTITLQVEGPISLAGTTTRERLYEDNANRSILIYPDNSPTQQEAIMHYQRARSAGTIDSRKEEQIKEQFKDIQSVLQPIAVRNPYAHQLKIPTEVLKPLRSNAHYLAFIETITFYHQYQRPRRTDPQSGQSYIQSSLDDIRAANHIIKEVLLTKADELTGACRRFLEQVKAWLKKEQKESFYSKEIRQALRLHPSNMKRYMIQLSRYGYVKILSGSRARGYEYQINSPEEYSRLKNNINNILDELLDQIKNSGSVVHSGSKNTMNHSKHLQAGT